MAENDTLTTVREQVRRLLWGIYTAEGIEIWLTNAHAGWGGRTVDQMVTDGEAECVLQKADQLATGAYA